MNAVVIGLGSMGKRRLRLLTRHFTDIQVYGIDTDLQRRSFCEEEYGIKTYPSIQEAVNEIKIDCAFICTSPLSHSKLISQCLNYELHVFTELNLVADGYDENTTLADEKGLTLFLSSTALYRKETQYIIDKVKENKASVCYNYHVGQYLPDWHPWENYKNFFVGDKRSNGCREILAIELPWIISAFGKISDMHVISDRITSLDINYDDYYMIHLIHENGSKGNLVIDVVSREAVRKLEIFNEKIYLEWQGRPDSLKSKNIDTRELETIMLYKHIDKLENYSSTIIENQYLDEICAFFDELKGVKKAKYTFADDYYTLEMIDKIEGNY
jgi:predicted dehydrogenase